MKIINRMLAKKTKHNLPLHLTQTPTPFFIVGSGRCGTTLLRRELSNVASVHIPPETFALPDAIHAFTNSSTSTWEELVERVLARFDYHLEFHYFELPSLRPLAHQLKALPVEERCLEKIITGIYCYHAQFHGNKYEVWGDKTPMHIWHMRAIQDIYPNVKFVHLIRDGADVVSSRVNSHDEYSIKKAAERWASAIHSFNNFSSGFPCNCHVVKYEDLVSNTVPVIKQLCDFLEISCDVSKIDQCDNVAKMGDVAVLKHHENVFNPINTSSIGKGRENFSEEERLILHKLIGAELKSLGYQSLI
ncbi:MAG: sulfotransferase [Candidatus Sedimenticola sp. (ex Thyasira tokunagai)]